jgi:hypothetical protein
VTPALGAVFGRLAYRPGPWFAAGCGGKVKCMSFWSKLRSKRQARLEEVRRDATLKAAAEGATPEQARKAGDRAARRGTTNAAITGSIS